jgi:hypothetical protein
MERSPPFNCAARTQTSDRKAARAGTDAGFVLDLIVIPRITMTNIASLILPKPFAHHTLPARIFNQILKTQISKSREG